MQTVINQASAECRTNLPIDSEAEHRSHWTVNRTFIEAPFVSGRWLTIIAVTGCVALVAFALWQRSQTTEHVRQFWGPAQARLIQHGSKVWLSKNKSDWEDISQAPGLVHLRATLVDDRYYQWNSLRLVTEPTAATHYALHFEQADESIELSIDPDSGLVTNLQNQQSVPLIPASARAVKAYLSEICP